MPKRSAAAAPSQPTITTTVQMPNTAAANAAPAETEETKPFFWERLARIPAEKWEKEITMYVYRVGPKARMIGEGGYLDILTQPITPLYIKQRWGGGRFRLLVLENNRFLYSTEEDIEGDPIYDKKREVVPDAGVTAANAAAVAASTSGDAILKVLEQQNNRLYEVLTTLQGSKDENPAITSAVEILSTAYKSGLNALTTQPAGGATGDAQQATKLLESVLGIVERINAARGGGGGVGTGATDKLITAALENFLRPPKSLAEQLKEIKEIRELLGDEGDERPKDWKAMLAKTLADHATDIVDALRTQPQPRAVRSPVPPAPAPAQAPGGAPPQLGGRLQVVPRDGVDAAAPPAAAAASPGADVAANGLTPEQELTAIKVTCVNMVRAGASGGAIAAFLEDVAEDVAQDLAKYPPDAITDFFMRDPVLKLMVEDPRWKDVLADAREYLSEGAEDADPVAAGKPVN